MEKLFHAMKKSKDLLEEVAEQSEKAVKPHAYEEKNLGSNDASKTFLIYKLLGCFLLISASAASIGIEILA